MTLEQSPDAKLRLFVAVEFPAEIKSSVADTLVRVKKGSVFSGAHPSWVRPEGVHITLVFLGWQSAERLPVLTASVRDSVEGCEAFQLKLGKLELFPDPREPRVVSLAVAGQLDKLRAVHATVADGCRAAGFDIDARPLRPHVTLGRIKSRKGLAGLAGVVRSHADMARGEFEVTKLTLFQSHLGQGGSTYTVVEEFPLKTNAGFCA